MALFDRRTVIATLAFAIAMLLMVGTTTTIYYHYRQCREGVDSESISPDGQWSAAVMSRRSDDSPLIIHVNLRRMGDPVPVGLVSGCADVGQVFAVERREADPELVVEWNALRQLTIQCSGCKAARVRMREDHWGSITLRYSFPIADKR